jgi:DNA-binding transcriptional ArsR family regulator
VTAQLVQTTLSLGQIVLDDRAWPRAALDEERVELFCDLYRDTFEQARRERAGWTDPLPPLVVVADGRGGYVLADGRHRYAARRRLGADFAVVQAAVFHPDGRAPVDCAYELALGYATISAKPLTTAEKRAAIERLIDERPEVSNREIARLVGVSHSTVNQHRRRVDDSSTAGNASEDWPSKWGPLRWEVAARRLAKYTAELLDSCRNLFGGANSKRSGHRLYDALADLYGNKGAVEVIDELSEVVIHARAHARKVARVE